MQIKSLKVTALKAQLNQPFRTALGVHESVENILFTLELANGVKGFGEAAIATHITGETFEQTYKNLEYVRRVIIGEPIDQYGRISERLHRELSSNASAIAAVETALLDSYTRMVKIPLWKFFGKSCQLLQSDITIVISDLKETQASVKKYYAKGFRAFKVKIGKDMDIDMKRLLAVKRLAPKGKIYLDANQGYSVEETFKLLGELEKHKIAISLLEQPVVKEDWEGLRKISRQSKILVCADESVQTLEDARRAIKQKLAPVFNIKIMKCGLLHAGKIASLARINNIKLMIGGMMETSLAMTTSAHLAAGMGGFDYIDLDTPFFIKGALKGNPYLSEGGQYNLKKVKEGVGIEF